VATVLTGGWSSTTIGGLSIAAGGGRWSIAAGGGNGP
jgi:hypothetical protein